MPRYFSLVALSTPNFSPFNPCQEKSYMELQFCVLYFVTKLHVATESLERVALLPCKIHAGD